MTEIFEKHYGKLIAFLTGFVAEALMDISAWIKALLPQLSYLKFIHLCYRAYRGDIDAAMEVIGILKERFGIGHPPGDGPVLGPRS